MNPYAAHLLQLAAGTAVGLAAVAGGTWAIDPYDVHGRPLLPDAPRPATRDHVRLTKAHQVARLRPEVVFLGTSRVECGLDPDARAVARWRGRVYDLGISGSTAYEARRYLVHAQAQRPLALAVWGLDYFSFGAPQRTAPGFDAARLATAPDRPGAWAPDLAATLLSLDAAADALRTLRDPDGLGYRPDGFWPPANRARQLARAGGVLAETTRLERQAADAYRLYPFTGPGGERPGLDEFRAAVRFARAAKIDLRPFFSPAHARESAVIAAIGGWDDYEAWKRAVVAVWAEEAPGAAALLDFSGYNARTTAAIEATPYFTDARHYTPAFGEDVLDRVVGGAPAAPWGVPLAPGTVEAGLRAMRAGRDAYR